MLWQCNAADSLQSVTDHVVEGLLCHGSPQGRLYGAKKLAACELHSCPHPRESVCSSDSHKQHLQILGAIAALGVCMARAGHAAWCGGCRPRFLAPEEATQHGSVQVAHPP